MPLASSHVCQNCDCTEDRTEAVRPDFSSLLHEYLRRYLSILPFKAKVSDTGKIYLQQQKSIPFSLLSRSEVSAHTMSSVWESIIVVAVTFRAQSDWQLPDSQL